MSEYKLQIAELLVRSFAGILFLFQGYDKLFRIKMPGVIEVFTADADRYHIPLPMIKLVAYYTSIVEFFGGIFLLFGFFTSYALYALGLDLILVGIAFSYMTPVWDMKFVFPRLTLVVACFCFQITINSLVLIILSALNKYSEGLYKMKIFMVVIHITFY